MYVMKIPALLPLLDVDLLRGLTFTGIRLL